jgi:polyisoprenoid-binding protein YceI
MAKWKIDPDHSVAAFTARHFMITLVHGQFNTMNGHIQFDPENPTQGSVEVSIEAAGVHTGIPKRDEHLKSADFLDVEHCPMITFKSSRIDPVGVNLFKVEGELTLRGKIKPVTLDMQYLGQVKSPFDQDVTVGFSGTTRINRFDFDVNWNYEMEKGGLVVGKELLLNLEVEADLMAEA